jgi:hypothetical protein
VILTRKATEEYLSIGSMNSGHEDFSYNTCHSDTEGNLWQQKQSNLQYGIALRENSTEWRAIDIETKKCLTYQEYGNERHPIHYFLEPRFKTVVEKINSASCNTCHSKHSEKRVTIKTNYYINCQKDLTLKDDALNTMLIKNMDRNTCLECHDFHENHEYKDTIPLTTMKAYFEGGKIFLVRKKLRHSHKNNGLKIFKLIKNRSNFLLRQYI